MNLAGHKRTLALGLQPAVQQDSKQPAAEGREKRVRAMVI